MAKREWTMPEWMEPYRDLIGDTGGNTVEDLMTRDPKSANVTVNAPAALLCMSVESQVSLLNRLHARGMLQKQV